MSSVASVGVSEAASDFITEETATGGLHSHSYSEEEVSGAPQGSSFTPPSSPEVWDDQKKKKKQEGRRGMGVVGEVEGESERRDRQGGVPDPPLPSRDCGGGVMREQQGDSSSRQQPQQKSSNAPPVCRWDSSRYVGTWTDLPHPPLPPQLYDFSASSSAAETGRARGRGKENVVRNQAALPRSSPSPSTPGKPVGQSAFMASNGEEGAEKFGTPQRRAAVVGESEHTPTTAIRRRPSGGRDGFSPELG